MRRIDPLLGILVAALLVASAFGPELVCALSPRVAVGLAYPRDFPSKGSFGASQSAGHAPVGDPWGRRWAVRFQSGLAGKVPGGWKRTLLLERYSTGPDGEDQGGAGDDVVPTSLPAWERHLAEGGDRALFWAALLLGWSAFLPAGAPRSGSRRLEALFVLGLLIPGAALLAVSLALSLEAVLPELFPWLARGPLPPWLSAAGGATVAATLLILARRPPPGPELPARERSGPEDPNPGGDGPPAEPRGTSPAARAPGARPAAARSSGAAIGLAALLPLSLGWLLCYAGAHVVAVVARSKVTVGPWVSARAGSLAYQRHATPELGTLWRDASGGWCYVQGPLCAPRQVLLGLPGCEFTGLEGGDALIQAGTVCMWFSAPGKVCLVGPHGVERDEPLAPGAGQALVSLGERGPPLAELYPRLARSGVSRADR
ncbi:MAG: hypothetical protein AB7N76_00355 [Planctomycetota bacterium]